MKKIYIYIIIIIIFLEINNYLKNTNEIYKKKNRVSY